MSRVIKVYHEVCNEIQLDVEHNGKVYRGIITEVDLND